MKCFLAIALMIFQRMRRLALGRVIWELCLSASASFLFLDKLADLAFYLRRF